MLTFRYQAIDSGGVRSQGEIDAEDRDSAIAQLAERGLMVAKISEKTAQALSLGFGRSKLGLNELERFTSELALLLRNGVRIDKGLLVLVRNTGNPAEKRFLQAVLDAVRSGESLSDALVEFPSLFSSTYLSLVKTGEASGRLDEVFEQLARDLKYRRKLTNQILQALTYPLVILFVCLLSIAFVFNYIVPQMEPLFAGAASLPSYTTALLAVSDWFRSYQWHTLIAFVALILLMMRMLRSSDQRDRLLSRVSRWPLAGSLVLLVNQVQANSTMSLSLIHI